jgi:hypothetical protein
MAMCCGTGHVTTSHVPALLLCHLHLLKIACVSPLLPAGYRSGLAHVWRALIDLDTELAVFVSGNPTYVSSIPGWDQVGRCKALMLINACPADLSKVLVEAHAPHSLLSYLLAASPAEAHCPPALAAWRCGGHSECRAQLHSWLTDRAAGIATSLLPLLQ